MPSKTYHLLDLNFQGIPEVIGAYLIPTEEGYILIESGPHSCWSSLVSELEKLGLHPSDIKHVFLTHIHLDHAGAAWALAEAGAQVYVHPAGRDHLIDPSKLMASATRIYGDAMHSLWGEMHPINPEQIYAVEDQATYTLGSVKLQAHHTPGHAVHHIAWQMDDLLFCGDVGGIHISNGVVSPPCPPPEFNREDWLASIEIIRKLPVTTLVLTHFGEVTEKNTHLNTLELALHQWVAFFEGLRDFSDQSELTTSFLNYIHQSFYPPEMDATLREKYDRANPPWMSVAGITRYLRKKGMQ